MTNQNAGTEDTLTVPMDGHEVVWDLCDYEAGRRSAAPCVSVASTITDHHPTAVLRRDSGQHHQRVGDLLGRMHPVPPHPFSTSIQDISPRRK